MANESGSFCRLCAEAKSTEKLLDLQCDNDMREEINEKLSRLNSRSLDLHLPDNLPKTVCFVCKDSLDKALDFIARIENAQNVLRDIFLEKIVKAESDHADQIEMVIANESNCPLEVLDGVKNEDKSQVVLKVEYDSDIDVFRGDLSDISAKYLSTATRKGRKRKKKESFRFIQEMLDDNDVPLSKLKCNTWKDYPWQCLYCNIQFFTLNELKDHSMELHNSCLPFKCIDCKYNVCRTLDRFVDHVCKHKKHLNLCCYVCNELFASREDTNTHLLNHSSGNGNQCRGCNTNFTDAEQLTDHLIRYYNKKLMKKATYLKHIHDMPMSCDICHKSFANRGNLNKHRQIHKERRRDHTCEKCGKRFYDKGTLGSHMMLHDNHKKHNCEICKACFRTASQLRTHVGIHGGPRPYACDQCGRMFRLRSQLKSHLIIHTDSLPYVCEFCNKAFRFKTILTQHLRQHTGVKPYCCEHCLREFTNWPNYNKHMKRRHSVDMAKKKHTPDGVFPINPMTGEVLSLPNSSQTEEWKRKVMVPKQRGRPRLKADLEIQRLDNNENIDCI